jgi:hypothetical protein
MKESWRHFDRADEDQLVADMIELARQYGRYGYRRIAALLRDAGYLPLFRAACKRMDAFCRRRGFPPTWIYVHEAPQGKANTHFLIHVPKRHQKGFFSHLPNWFGATGGTAIDIQQRNWRPGPDRRLQYMTKGTDAVTASRIGGRAKRQGDIRFKRCGTTINIGPAARARFKAPVKAPSKPRKW